MKMDTVDRALAEVAASRALRERQLANRMEIQRKAATSARPLYVLQSKKQLELRLQ